MQVRYIVIPLVLAGCQKGELLDCAEGYERAADGVECVCIDCPETPPTIETGTPDTTPPTGGTGTTGTGTTGTGTTGTGTTGTGTTGTGTTGTGTPPTGTPPTGTPPTGTGTPPTGTGTPPTGTGTPPTGGTGTPTPTPVTYNLQVNGSGFVPAVPVHLAVIDDLTGLEVAGGMTAVGAAGNFSIAFPASLESGASYTVDLFEDATGNGACDAALEDSWRVAFGPVAADVAQPVDAVNDLDAGACATFP